MVRSKIGVDTETHLIARGLAAPPLVCTSLYGRVSTNELADVQELLTSALGHPSKLVHVDQCKQLWRRLLNGPRTLVLCNASFDLAVVCAQYPELIDSVFLKYRRGEIQCIRISQRLLDIRNGCLGGRPGTRYTYSLAALAKRYLGLDLAKGADTWRLRYAELQPLPISQWPAEAVQYAMQDAEIAFLIGQKIDEQLEHSQIVQRETYAAFALHLQTCRGIMTDRDACLALIDATQKEIDRCKDVCVEAGLIDATTGKKSLKLARSLMLSTLTEEQREALTKAVLERKSYNTKQERDARMRVKARHGLNDSALKKAAKKLDKLLRRDISHEELLQRWPYSEELYVALRSLARPPKPFRAHGVNLTKSGTVSVNADAAKQSGHPSLKALATYTSANTQVKKAQRMLLGAELPLQVSYETPLETGRTSCRASDAPLVGDNLQNLPRVGMVDQSGEPLPGQRECLVPREGYLFVSVDGTSAEMRSAAQNAIDHLGWSKLGDALNAGQNVHRVLGADIYGIDHEAFERLYASGDARAKQCAQFAKIPNFSKLGGGGDAIMPDYARQFGIELTLERAKELGTLFHRRWTETSAMHEHYKGYIHKVYKHPRTGFERYLDRYAQACNHPFQHLVAAAMKYAGCRLAEECYMSAGSLLGAHPVLFMHDQYLLEVPARLYSEYAWRIARTFCEACTTDYMPDVPMTTEPIVMRRFAKDAKYLAHPTALDSEGNPLLLIND